MTFAAPLLGAGVLGALFLILTTRSARLPLYPLFILALAFPVGFSLCSFILFGAYLISPNQGTFLSILSVTGLGAFLLAKLIQSPAPLWDTHPKKLFAAWQGLSGIKKMMLILCSLIWLHTFFKLLILFRVASIANIFGGWDAMFFWNVKARFFFQAPAEWKNMFSTNLSWAHPDYPLLLSGSVAWGWNWTGQELQIWPALVAFIFYFSTALLIGWYLSTAVHAVSGLIASAFFMAVPVYAFWGVSQYADVPLSFFIAASGLVLTVAFRSNHTALFFLAGWLAGCSAWTKNEGIFFTGWVTLVSLAVFWMRGKTIPGWKNCLLNLGLGIAIPFAAIFILKVHLAESGDYLGSGRGIGTYLKSIFMDWPKTKILLQSFPIYMKDKTSWNGLWIFFAIAGVLGFWNARLRRNYAWVSGTLAFLILFGYFMILHTSPHDVVWQIQTALQRLLMHSGVLALIFTFEFFGNPLPPSVDTNKKRPLQ